MYVLDILHWTSHIVAQAVRCQLLLKLLVQFWVTSWWTQWHQSRVDFFHHCSILPTEACGSPNQAAHCVFKLGHEAVLFNVKWYWHH